MLLASIVLGILGMVLMIVSVVWGGFRIRSVVRKTKERLEIRETMEVIRVPKAKIPGEAEKPVEPEKPQPQLLFVTEPKSMSWLPIAFGVVGSFLAGQVFLDVAIMFYLGFLTGKLP